MADKHKFKINYDESTGEYIDCAVDRGFPMGGIGSGGFGIGSDGRFTEFRMNNNWMCPIRGVRGAFFAVHAKRGDKAETRILRRATTEPEYENIRPIRSTRFRGELPGFELRFHDDLPVRVTLRGFTPHIPHNVKDSTIPGAVFTMTLENESPEKTSVSALLSWENIIGLGGTGHTGLRMLTRSIPIGPMGRLVYGDIMGNYQEAMPGGSPPRVAFKINRAVDPRSHRRGTMGEYRIAAIAPDGFETMLCEGWNALEIRPSILAEFAASGRINAPERPYVGSETCRPAGAAAVSGELEAGESVDVDFIVAWWTPEHVTEKNPVRKASSGEHDGKRVGHVYENFFDGPDEVVDYLAREKDRLRDESFELSRAVDGASLPDWLKRAVKNSIDSTMCNTIVTRAGDMYTIEGMDWQWPFGGLTGTNDQRLSAHPYTSVFFTSLDMTEVDAFRRLTDSRGSVPHGNGNCDMALGDTDVPYGWPVELVFILPAKEWTDLTMSEIIQAGKLYRITGDEKWLRKFWPDMKKMAGYLDSICRHGVPEGGTTYDIWDFPGTFIYNATVYIAAMATMADLAEECEPEAAEGYREKIATCRERIYSVLWDEGFGYFRSTPDKETVFTAAMAGDWLARYAGLGSAVEPDKARRHMRLQHDVLVGNARLEATRKGFLPKPWAQATPEGRLIKQFNIQEKKADSIYIWQVVSYQAFEHIYLGQVDKGLDVLRMIYDRLYRKGLAWSAGLMANPDSVYMTHPVLWALFNAVTGAALDVPRGTLRLSPRAMPGAGKMTMPFFFPGFWAVMEHDPASGDLSIEVTRHFGDPVKIGRIIISDEGGEEKDMELDPALEMTAGVRWEIR